MRMPAARPLPPDSGGAAPKKHLPERRPSWPAAMASNMPGSALIGPTESEEADVQDHIFRLSKDGVRALPHPSAACCRRPWRTPCPDR